MLPTGYCTVFLTDSDFRISLRLYKDIIIQMNVKGNNRMDLYFKGMKNLKLLCKLLCK